MVLGIDLAGTPVAATAPTNHAGLSGLELAGAGVTWGHINDQTQTLAGAKTLSSSATVSVDSTAALTVEKADGTDILVVDTTNNKTTLTGALDVSGTSTFRTSPIVDLGSNTATTKIFYVATGGTSVTQNIGTLGGSDWLAVGLRLTHSQYDGNGAAVFSAVAYRNGANRSAAIATAVSVGTAPSSPTVAWSGNILQVTVNETYSSCVIEAVVSLRGSTWAWS